MSTPHDAPADERLEECIDELDAAIEGLGQFPHAVLALALRAHLAGLLRAMAAADLLTDGQVQQFLAGLEADVLQRQPGDEPSGDEPSGDEPSGDEPSSAQRGPDFP